MLSPRPRSIMSTREDKVVLNVLLNCEETKSSETKHIHFQSLPTTPLEIKKKIELDFSIPSCVQTLRYQSMILKDSGQLQHTHFRSGDTFTVDYPTKAECDMAQNVMKWLKDLYELLKSIEENTSSPAETDLLMSSNFHRIRDFVMKGEKDEMTAALSYDLFAPWTNRKKLTNKFYFHQEGGLDTLMKVYGMLVSKEWGDLGIDADLHIYLEGMCSRAIINYVQRPLFGHLVVQLGGFEMCTIALLRKQLQGSNTILKPQIYYCLEKALHALTK